MRFIEFKKFGFAHKVAVIANEVIQYEEVIQQTLTKESLKCVKLSMRDGRSIYVDVSMDKVAKEIDNARRLDQIEGVIR